MDRQAHNDQRFFWRVLHVEQDRPPGAHHFAQQAAGDHAFAGLADGAFSGVEAKSARVTLIHPDDIGITINDHRAFTGLLDDLEQRADRQRAHALVVLEAFGGVHLRADPDCVLPVAALSRASPLPQGECIANVGASLLANAAMRSNREMPTPDAPPPTAVWYTDAAANQTHHDWRRARPLCRP